jgi:hypothetical protein
MSKFSPYQPYRPPEQSSGSGGAGIIILFCILWTLFAPVPGPIDDLVVWAYGAYSAVRGLK